MTSIWTEHTRLPAEFAFAGVIVEALDHPALLVQDSETILVANARWRQLFTDLEDPSTLPTVPEWLRRFDAGDTALQALGNQGDANAPSAVCLVDVGPEGKRRFAVRVRHAVGSTAESPVTAVIITELQDHESDHGEALRPTGQMNRLLVRQTLIEERERRRLGRAVHDHVTQLLVRVRRRLADATDEQPGCDLAQTIVDVDDVMHMLQELTSNFSPPVLEDLGLLPAMRWLAEHIATSYGAAVRCEDDGVEPRLSPEVRIIAFRAIRELAINAAKHAPGARIVLTSGSDAEGCRLAVDDDGPGFDLGAGRFALGSSTSYGLLSVEQQIRAVGGTLELRSGLGEGTHAMISLAFSSTHTNAEGGRDA